MRLKALTYNIHGCVGRAGRFDPGAIVAVVRGIDADVVALQEVHDHDERDRSFLRMLRALDYSTLIFGSTLHRQNGHYGNVLLSRLPLVEQQLIDLSVAGREPRGAIRARLAAADGELDVLTTHLGLMRRERRVQIARLFALLPARWHSNGAGLRIALGDFNEWLPAGRTHRDMHALFGVAPRPATFPAALPLIGLDRIFVRPAQVRVTWSAVRTPLADRASDHLPLLATIET